MNDTHFIPVSIDYHQKIEVWSLFFSLVTHEAWDFESVSNCSDKRFCLKLSYLDNFSILLQQNFLRII